MSKNKNLMIKKILTLLLKIIKKVKLTFGAGLLELAINQITLEPLNKTLIPGNIWGYKTSEKHWNNLGLC